MDKKEQGMLVDEVICINDKFDLIFEILWDMKRGVVTSDKIDPHSIVLIENAIDDLYACKTNIIKINRVKK